MTGLLLCFVALLLVLSLLHYDGFLLKWINIFFTGLIGGSVYLLAVMLVVAGVLCMSRVQPYRLRAVCVLLIPVIWSAIVQSVVVKGTISPSFKAIGTLWTSGIAMQSGGALGGTISMIFAPALSQTGARIILVMLLLVCIFAALNRTPWALAAQFSSFMNEELEKMQEERARQAEEAEAERLSEGDMTVTPAKRKAKPAAQAKIPEPQVQPKQQKPPLLERLRSRVAYEPEEEEMPLPEAEPVAVAAQAAEVPVQPEPERPSLGELIDSLDIPDEPEEPDEQPEYPTAAAEESAEDCAEDVANDLEQASQIVVPEYRYPTLDLLKEAPRVRGSAKNELTESSERLVDTLKSFSIEAQIINIVRGPSVTRYELQIERGTKFSKLTALSDDIALALGASSVRIAPIPEKVAVGIEVPNKNVQMVALREVLASSEFQQSDSSLSVALGKDITGESQVIDIAKMPHLLIAGTTGSGKSVCINSILLSLLYKSSPEEVRLIMVDPKMVELGNYNGVPHLLIPVVTDPRKASGALNWAVGEMERRYALFAANAVRDLAGYNRVMKTKTEAGEPGEHRTLPQIVIVIDELADLMMVAAKEVETSICRIAQKARAAGMHLVVATQRPSADVITGIMKSNIPSRIAFAVSSQIESRIILDTHGAEKLVGKGDMLYSPIGMGKPVRIQGCFVSSEEIENVISHVKQSADVEYSQEVMDHIERQSEESASPAPALGGGDEDELINEAITIVVESGQASVSMLQRRLRLGYARAARLVDQMEDRGIVGPFEGSKPRQVLISKEEWMEIQLRQQI